MSCSSCAPVAAQCTVLQLRVGELERLHRNQSKTIVRFITMLEDLARDIEREHPAWARDIREVLDK